MKQVDISKNRFLLSSLHLSNNYALVYFFIVSSGNWFDSYSTVTILPYIEMQFSNSIFGEVSGHKLRFSQTGVFSGFLTIVFGPTKCYAIHEYTRLCLQDFCIVKLMSKGSISGRNANI